MERDSVRDGIIFSFCKGWYQLTNNWSHPNLVSSLYPFLATVQKDGEVNPQSGLTIRICTLYDIGKLLFDHCTWNSLVSLCI